MPAGSAGRGLRSQNEASGRARESPQREARMPPPPELGSEPHSAPHMAEPSSGDHPHPGVHRAFTESQERQSVGSPGLEAERRGPRDFLGLATPSPHLSAVPQGKGLFPKCLRQRQIRAPQPHWARSCPRHLPDLHSPEHILPSSWAPGTALGPGEAASGQLQVAAVTESLCPWVRPAVGRGGPLAAVFLGWGPPGISGHGWRCATSCPAELGCGCQAPWGAL